MSGRILGQSMDLVINESVLACAKNFVLTMSAQQVEVTYGSSHKWRDAEYVKTSWQVQASHLYSTTYENLIAIFTAIANHDAVEIVMRRTDLEGYQYYGSAIITNLTLGAGLDEPVGFNFTMVGKGELYSEEIQLVLADENGDYMMDENGDFLIG